MKHEDTLLEELYSIDPSFQERADETRFLLSALREYRPHINPEDEFVRTLREKLIDSRTHTRTFNNPIVSSWFIPLMPIGAVALLMLALLPTLQNSFTPTTPSTEIMLTTELASEDASIDTFAAREADTDSSISTLSATEYSADSFTVGTHAPGDTVLIEGVVLAAPSFFIIQPVYQDELGEMIGVSPLLLPEEETVVTVPLMTTTVDGEMYAATLYRDDGDGIFTIERDQPVLEPYTLAPLSAYFFITTEVYETTPLDERYLETSGS